MTGYGGDVLGAARSLASSMNASLRRTQERREHLREAEESLETARQFGELHEEIAQLRLHLAVVISMLLRSGAVTKEAYKQVAEAIDAGDGVADGMFDGSIATDGTMSAETEKDSLRLRELAKTIREMR